MKPTSNNGKTITLLQDLCQASLIIIERQLKDQLPGGHYWDPSEALQHQVRSCSATNISGERNFAIVNQIIYCAKNAKPSYVESKVMFQVNKTSSWLVERDNAANHKCTDHARKVARKNTEADKERKEQLQRELQEKPRLSRQRIHQRENTAREKIEQWFELAYKHGGLWISPGKIEDETRKLSMTGAKSILKAQINIWTKVMKCTGEQISFTHATVDQLNPIHSPLYRIGRRRPVTSRSITPRLCFPMVINYILFESLHHQLSDRDTAKICFGREYRPPAKFMSCCRSCH